MNISKKEISLKAYELWQARGCPISSPEEDWYAAEALLHTAADRALDEQGRAKPGSHTRYGLRDYR
jgi:hypothetical protein